VNLAAQQGISTVPGVGAVTRRERKLCSHTAAPHQAT